MKSARTKAKRNPIPTVDDLCEYEYPDGVKCDMPYASLNEVFFGTANRQKSIEHGMQIRLCEQRGHHQYFHANREYQIELQERYQRMFEGKLMRTGSTAEEARTVFRNIFGKSYL